MGTILVTGASGFIGSALCASLSQEHEVIAMSRSRVEIPKVAWVRGSFWSFEDLRQLDGREIDVVVHLAAVLGGAPEHECMMINAEGSRCMMRFLIDNGCKKFVTASSIAAVGFQNVKFRPDQLPIPDEHPCYDRDGYGFGKYMMEEVTKYHQRQNQDIDVINLRLSSVIPEDGGKLKPLGVRSLKQWALGSLTVMLLPDAVRAFSLAALSAYRPGMRILNTTAKRAWATAPTADILANWWGDDVDLSYYRESGNERHNAYMVARIKEELGFTADRTVEFLENL
ncbi:MAG: hypothetical protein CMN78_05155 [Spirochaetales bacterium]|nr:hypothetical protein [Spirochaetales bacterium]